MLGSTKEIEIKGYQFTYGKLAGMPSQQIIACSEGDGFSLEKAKSLEGKAALTMNRAESFSAFTGKYFPEGAVLGHCQTRLEETEEARQLLSTHYVYFSRETLKSIENNPVWLLFENRLPAPESYVRFENLPPYSIRIPAQENDKEHLNQVLQAIGSENYFNLLHALCSQSGGGITIIGSDLPVEQVLLAIYFGFPPAARLGLSFVTNYVNGVTYQANVRFAYTSPEDRTVLAQPRFYWDIKRLSPLPSPFPYVEKLKTAYGEGNLGRMFEVISEYQSRAEQEPRDYFEFNTLYGYLTALEPTVLRVGTPPVPESSGPESKPKDMPISANTALEPFTSDKLLTSTPVPLEKNAPLTQLASISAPAPRSEAEKALRDLIDSDYHLRWHRWWVREMFYQNAPIYFRRWHNEGRPSPREQEEIIERLAQVLLDLTFDDPDGVWDIQAQRMIFAWLEICEIAGRPDNECKQDVKKYWRFDWRLDDSAFRELFAAPVSKSEKDPDMNPVFAQKFDKFKSKAKQWFEETFKERSNKQSFRRWLHSPLPKRPEPITTSITPTSV